MDGKSDTQRKILGERAARLGAGAFIVLAMMLLLVPIGTGKQLSIASQLNTQPAP